MHYKNGFCRCFKFTANSICEIFLEKLEFRKIEFADISFFIAWFSKYNQPSGKNSMIFADAYNLKDCKSSIEENGKSALIGRVQNWEYSSLLMAR